MNDINQKALIHTLTAMKLSSLYCYYGCEPWFSLSKHFSYPVHKLCVKWNSASFRSILPLPFLCCWFFYSKITMNMVYNILALIMILWICIYEFGACVRFFSMLFSIQKYSQNRYVLFSAKQQLRNGYHIASCFAFRKVFFLLPFA